MTVMASIKTAGLALAASLLAGVAGPARAEGGLLETITKHTTLASTVPANGDLNPMPWWWRRSAPAASRPAMCW
jgi:hypothetical protein